MPKVQKTVHGIRLNIDPRIFTDIEFVDIYTDVMAEDDSSWSEEERAMKGAQRAKRSRDMGPMLFGDDLEKIKSKLRKENDGFLDYETWNGFIADVIFAYQKNSNARPAPERA